MYNLPTTVDPNKVFLINRSELEGRLEVQYYLPEIYQLEKTVREMSKKKLKDFIIKMSSGATPSVQEEEKYYGDEVNGIPFLRVQNLNSNSRLDLSNVKYINKETHENYLKRSQVLEGDLLVKITGVGRMAIASVAPVGFVGNTNQHMSVIKTEKKEISDYLANYLNLDIVERLASRRATGATRPALDYPALKSIPIIENIDFSVLDKAERLKQQKEAEAKALLESIDTYLLGELGISLEEKNQTFYFQEPEPRYGIHYKIQKDYELNKTNKLVQEGKIFLTNFLEVTGGRYDPKLYDHNTKGLKRAIENGRFKNELLKNLITQSAAGDWGQDGNEVLGSDFIKSLVIRATEFDNQYNLRLDNSRVKYRWIHKDKLAKIDIQENDLLIEKSGGSPDQPVGRIAIVTKDMIEENRLCYSNFIHKIRVDTSKVNPKYLFYLLKTFHNIKLTDSMQSQTNGIRNLIMREYFNQTIPLPFMEDLEKSLKKQTEIAEHIQNIHSQAKALQHEAAKVLEEAKREVEKMILGE